MKNRVTVSILLVMIVVMPTLASARTQPVDMSTPPLSQPLVREGTFAVHLVKALKLSDTTNEIEAESVLTKAGIAPSSGWISDYPVTPDVLGDIKAAITKAVQGGTIASTDAGAQSALLETENSYSMTVAPGPSAAPQEQSGSGYYDESVIGNYYNTEGPPVVTYYAPPPDYSYLYSWVSYPFWWWGWWFPGYYMLTSFTFPAYYGYWPGVWYPYHRWYGKNYCYRNWNGHVYWGNHGPWNNTHVASSTTAISNHFRDPVTRTMGTINPGTRTITSGTKNQSISHWATPRAEASARAIFNANRVSIRGTGPQTQGKLASNNPRVDRAYTPRATTQSYNYHRNDNNYASYRTYRQPRYALHYNTLPGRSQFSSTGNLGQRTSIHSSHSYATHSFNASGTRYSSGGSRGFSAGRH